MNCKMLVCCHKQCDIPSNEIYLPIQVGKALSNIDLEFIGDDIGDNISKKNKEYCEITAVYWAWKNLKNVDIIGLNHYRRFFNLNKESIEKILCKYDLILPNRLIVNYRNIFDFDSYVTRENSMIFLDVLIKLYPSYKQDAIDFLYNSNKWSRYNMFITNWNNFDNFCNFMFPILFEMEKIVIPSGYSRINRVYGYVAETLWPIYAHHNHLKIKYTDISRIDYPYKPSKVQKLRDYIYNIKKDISFKLAKGKDFYGIPIYDAVITGLHNDGINLDLNK